MLEIIDHGAVREIRLARPPANAISEALAQAVGQAVLEASESADAVVVSGRTGMFSGGLDIPQMIDMDRVQLAQCWRTFQDMLRRIATSPVPVAFALTGHAPAGGIVMALFGDFRVMPKGPWKTGVNEVQVGLTLPRLVHRALARLIGPHRAERIAVAGEIMEAQKALEIGLVDELAEDPEATVARAIQWCEQHLALPRDAMLETRAQARADLCRLAEEANEEDIDGFCESWFRESTQVALQALVSRLKKR